MPCSRCVLNARQSCSLWREAAGSAVLQGICVVKLIFETYARDDSMDVHNLCSMSCRELITMCLELGLIG